jgi:hypothetical protein
MVPLPFPAYPCAAQVWRLPCLVALGGGGFRSQEFGYGCPELELLLPGPRCMGSIMRLAAFPPQFSLTSGELSLCKLKQQQTAKRSSVRRVITGFDRQANGFFRTGFSVSAECTADACRKELPPCSRRCLRSSQLAACYP